MCKPGNNIKLCTCEPSDIDPYSRWTLFRGKKRSHVVGSIVKPSLLNERKRSLLRSLFEIVLSAISSLRWFIMNRRLLALLNSGKAFDFDYKPAAGDALEIVFSGEVFEFTIKTGSKWKTKNSRGFFSRLTFEMRAIMQGKVKRI